MILSDVDVIMKKRAEKLANRAKKSIPTVGLFSVTVFSAGQEQFGIPTESLSCIVKTPKIAYLPNLHSWIRGVVQVRGEIVTVVDLAMWFASTGRPNFAFTAIVEGLPGKIGLLVDRVDGFRKIGLSDLCETLDDTSIEFNRPIRATTKDLITILDIDRLFTCSDVRAGSSDHKTVDERFATKE